MLFAALTMPAVSSTQCQPACSISFGLTASGSRSSAGPFAALARAGCPDSGPVIMVFLTPIYRNCGILISFLFGLTAGCS